MAWRLRARHRLHEPERPVDRASDDEIVAQRNILQSLRKMSMNPSSMRYHGKSSSLLFIQTAMDLKQEYAGIELPKTIDPDAHTTLLRRRQQYWSLHPVRVYIDSIFTYGEARLTMFSFLFSLSLFLLLLLLLLRLVHSSLRAVLALVPDPPDDGPHP